MDKKRGCSGFIRNPENEKIVYVNTEANCASWLQSCMYRYASSLKDYSSNKLGIIGKNNFCSEENLALNIIKMLQAKDEKQEIANIMARMI